jgi:hypothetical protein
MPTRSCCCIGGSVVSLSVACQHGLPNHFNAETDLSGFGSFASRQLNP